MGWVYSEELKLRTGNGWSDEPDPQTSKLTLPSRIMAYNPKAEGDPLPEEDRCGEQQRKLNLNDYSHTAAQRGWGAGWPSCTGAAGQMKTIITKQSGVKVTVHQRIAQLALLLLDETERRGYLCKSGQTGAYNCRQISGTSTPSNHSWALAIDINWQDNPYTSNVKANNIPSWMPPLWNRYGFAWGGNYSGAHDFMHFEFMGTPAEADSLTVQAQRELTGTGNGAPVMPPNTAQQVDEIHEQVTGVLRAWAGGITDDKSTPYNLLQHLLRVSVTTNQNSLMLQKLLQNRQVQLHADTVDQLTEAVVEGVHARTSETVADITHRAVVDELATSGFWASALERAGKTFAQTALVLFGAGPLDVLHIDWTTTLSLSAGAALVSVLTSLASAQTGAKGTPSLVKERN
jgi:hypothetical protein